MNIIDILILAVLGVSPDLRPVPRLYQRGAQRGGAHRRGGGGLRRQPVAGGVAPGQRYAGQYADVLHRRGQPHQGSGSLLLTVSQVTQGALTQIMAGAQLPKQFQAAFINAVNTAPGATTMATLLSQTIVNVSLSILSFLICFLGCYIVATFVIHLICYVFELPVLRHLDALMGGVFGLARGVLLLFILLRSCRSFRRSCRCSSSRTF